MWTSRSPLSRRGGGPMLSSDVGPFFLIPASGMVDADGLVIGVDKGVMVWGRRVVGPEALDVAFGRRELRVRG